MEIVFIACVTLTALIQFHLDYYKGMYFTLFCLILMPSNIAIDIGDALPSLTIHRILLSILIVNWFSNKELDKHIMSIPFIKPLIAVAASFAMSCAATSNILVSFKQYLFFLFEAFIFFIVIQTSIRDKSVMNNVIKAVNYALLGAALIGIWQKITGFNPTYLFGYIKQYAFEDIKNIGDPDLIESTYFHAILFGVACGCGLILNLLMLDDSNSPRKNLFHWISVFIMGSALFFSNKRGPWLATMMVATVMGLFYKKTLIKKGILITVVVLSVLVMRPGIYQSIMNKYEGTLDASSLEGSSYRWRFTVLHMATSYISNANVVHFLFGFGQGMHGFLDHGLVWLSTGRFVELESWDMEFAVILFENGIVGILLLFSLYTIVLSKSTFAYLRGETEGDTILIAISSLMILFFVKTNVKIFAVQLVYYEYLNFAIASALMMHNNESDYEIESALS